jgi:hypothetical protein
LVEELSSTVTSTPVAVFMVKPAAEVASMMPVEPPSAGPETGPPPLGPGAGAALLASALGVVVSADADGEVTRVTESPTTATSSAPATANPFLPVGGSRRTPGWTGLAGGFSWESAGSLSFIWHSFSVQVAPRRVAIIDVKLVRMTCA